MAGWLARCVSVSELSREPMQACSTVPCQPGHFRLNDQHMAHVQIKVLYGGGGGGGGTLNTQLLLH